MLHYNLQGKTQFMVQWRKLFRSKLDPPNINGPFPKLKYAHISDLQWTTRISVTFSLNFLHKHWQTYSILKHWLLSIGMVFPLDWVCSHQMDIVVHLTSMQRDTHVQKPFALFSCKKPKMQSESIQRFYTQKLIAMVRPIQFNNFFFKQFFRISTIQTIFLLIY